MSQRTTKTYKTCAISEDSDQPAHARSLIRVFADRVCLLQIPGYPKRDKQEALSYWVNVQVDRSLCWSHRSYCRFCRALAQYKKPCNDESAQKRKTSASNKYNRVRADLLGVSETF